MMKLYTNTLLRTAARAPLLARAASSYGDSVALTIEGAMPMMTEHVDIVNPATQEALSRVPLCTAAELDRAAASCEVAFDGWRNTSVSNRSRIMFRLALRIIAPSVVSSRRPHSAPLLV
jgi:malonate-semialdehyde dehydrogenase (acetylating)/methylmalonate-semialdehyde dehydrogenase